MPAKSKTDGSAEPGTKIGNAAGATSPGDASRPARQEATGQHVSKERGSSTRSKKNPGKRPKQGGSSA